MKVKRRYKSPFDDARFVHVGELEDYVKKNFIDKIPPQYKGDVAHFLYDLRHPGGRKCQVCGAKTKWNPKIKKYNVLCSNPGIEGFAFKNTLDNTLKNYNGKGNTCEAIMRAEYLKNIKRVRGTDNLMTDPEYHKMLLENRKIAEVVEIKHRGKTLKYTVIGSYEKEFILSWYKNQATKNILIQMPGLTINSPEKNTFTITDAYLPEYDILISIKDPGNNYVYEKQYRKSVYFYDYINNKNSKYKFIELNGLDQVKEGPSLIMRLIKGDLKVTDDIFKPVYYDKYK